MEKTASPPFQTSLTWHASMSLVSPVSLSQMKWSAKEYMGTSPVVQQLKFCAPNAGGPGSIPGWGTRFHMSQLNVHMMQLKILHATTKTQHYIYTYIDTDIDFLERDA